MAVARGDGERGRVVVELGEGVFGAPLCVVALLTGAGGGIIEWGGGDLVEGDGEFIGGEGNVVFAGKVCPVGGGGEGWRVVCHGWWDGGWDGGVLGMGIERGNCNS